MSHEIESAMFVGTPAWHKLGTVLDHVPSIAEAIKLSGLDWSVGLDAMFLSDGAKVPNCRAVVRESDRKVLGTVSDGFRTVQNSAAFAWFQPMLDSGMATLEAAGSLRGGARVWILAKLAGDDAVIVPKSDDRVAKYLLLAHGHDGSLAIRCGLTPTRVVCANTLSAAIGEGGTLSIRHTKGAADALQAAQQIMMKANAKFEKAAEIFRALAQINVTSAQIRAYVDSVFPPPKAKPVVAPVATDEASDFASLLARPAFISDPGEGRSDFAALMGKPAQAIEPDRSRIYGAIETLFQRGRGNDMPGVAGTAWAAYNAVTEYITHERGNSDDTRLNTQWFGAESPRAIQIAAQQFLGA